MKISLYLLLVISIALFNACDKKQACKDSLGAPVITSNSPLTAGDTLILSIPQIENATYSWFGPFQFRSYTSPVKMIAYDTYLSGQYSVQYLMPDCISDLATADIVINPVVSPCTFQKNHGELINSGSSASFVNIQFYTLNDSTEYTFDAYSEFGSTDISLIFGANVKPQNGAYTIVHDGNPNPGEAFFNLLFGGSGWDVYPGKIYINTVNSKLSATWCDLPCRRYFDGQTGVTSGNLTEP